MRARAARTMDIRAFFRSKCRKAYNAKAIQSVDVKKLRIASLELRRTGRSQ